MIMFSLLPPCQQFGCPSTLLTKPMMSFISFCNDGQRLIYDTSTIHCYRLTSNNGLLTILVLLCRIFRLTFLVVERVLTAPWVWPNRAISPVTLLIHPSSTDNANRFFMICSSFLKFSTLKLPRRWSMMRSQIALLSQRLRSSWCPKRWSPPVAKRWLKLVNTQSR